MDNQATRRTKIFLDGGDPIETREIAELLGFIDGQTTNPSLVAKNPIFQACKSNPAGCTEDDLWRAYRELVTEISPLVQESVSIEVYADASTKAEEMVEEALKLVEWIPNAYIKLPITTEGLIAAEVLVSKGVRINMTLCFNQAQAAAVYAATRGAEKGCVYLSPFVGRLDDLGINGMGLIRHIQNMYRDGDGHVSVLVASVRSIDHFMCALSLSSDIVTAPGKVLRTWAETGKRASDESFVYDSRGLTDTAYEEHDILADWRSFDVSHDLTAKGIERFASDWNNLLA